MNHKQLIASSFNRAASNYEAMAQIQKEIGCRLFERLYLLKMQPKYILDLGCGSGFFTEKLKKLYPKARVFSLDIAYDMLYQVKQKESWFKKWGIVNADMHKLPFVDAQFDLIFSNQVVHWSENMSGLMSELHRVMNKDACLMFSTLGPDTFKELRIAFAELDSFSHANDFLDMHDVGDIMLAANYLDPVIDMDMLTAHYDSLASLLKSLKKQGVININPKRNSALSGKNTFKNLDLAMQKFITDDNMYPLTYEVVYGHAWKGGVNIKPGVTKNTFTVAELRATLKASG